MNYCIYKLNFTSPLHCGRGDGAVSLTNTAMTLRADTIFSALCNELACMSDKKEIKEFISLCQDKKLLFSDTFPFHGDDFYLPVPVFPLADRVEFDVKNRKAIKKIKWLPAADEYFRAFSEYIQSGIMFDCNSLTKEFAKFRTDVKACVRNAEEDTKPFEVSVCEFEENCGLYGIIGYESDKDMNNVLALLASIGISGIGGQVSRGFGKFTLEVAENTDFFQTRLDKKINSYMLLTSSLPKTEEMEKALTNAYYNLIRRGGFSFSPYADTFKKQTQYYLSSGSVLKNAFSGYIYTVGENGRHDIYRYSKPIFLGVEL